MKTTIKTLLISSMLMLSNFILGQSPEGINYQATVRDASGNLMISQTVTVIFKIKKATATGTTVYQENHSLSTNDFGGFNAVIGKGTSITGTLSSIDWGTATYFLNVNVNGNDLGTTQMMSVPYALYAKNSASSESQLFEKIGNDIRFKNGNYDSTNFIVGSPSIDFDGTHSFRMFYVRKKGAFRAGISTNYNWDIDSIGNYSFAAGLNTKAIGTNSTALGRNTIAKGIYSTSIGRNSTSSGFASLSTGGYTKAFGNYSTAMGYYTTASGNYSTALGKYNDPSTYFLFSIGNGTSTSNRKNAMYINNVNNAYFRGTVAPMVNNTVSLGFPTFKWTAVYATNGTIQTSDTTLKTNITPLSYGLADLMKIKTISYNWKDDKYNVRKIGFNAQNLLQVIPEVVETHSEYTNEETGEVIYEKNETLGVFYSDMIPVLTKSVQEQQAIIESQNKKIELLIKKMKEMEELIQSKKQ